VKKKIFTALIFCFVIIAVLALVNCLMLIKSGEADTKTLWLSGFGPLIAAGIILMLLRQRYRKKHPVYYEITSLQLCQTLLLIHAKKRKKLPSNLSGQTAKTRRMKMKKIFNIFLLLAVILVGAWMIYWLGAEQPRSYQGLEVITHVHETPEQKNIPTIFVLTFIVFLIGGITAVIIFLNLKSRNTSKVTNKTLENSTRNNVGLSLS